MAIDTPQWHSCRATSSTQNCLHLKPMLVTWHRPDGSELEACGSELQLRRRDWQLQGRIELADGSMGGSGTITLHRQHPGQTISLRGHWQGPLFELQSLSSGQASLQGNQFRFSPSGQAWPARCTEGTITLETACPHYLTVQLDVWHGLNAQIAIQVPTQGFCLALTVPSVGHSGGAGCWPSAGLRFDSLLGMIHSEKHQLHLAADAQFLTLGCPRTAQRWQVPVQQLYQILDHQGEKLSLAQAKKAVWPPRLPRPGGSIVVRQLGGLPVGSR